MSDILKDREALKKEYDRIATYVRKHEEGAMNGTLTKEEYGNFQKALKEGWVLIQRYASALSYQMMGGYHPTTDEMMELQYELWMTYRKVLPGYHAEKGTPTTYFRCYFQGTIRTYIVETYHNLKQYDIQLYRRLRQIISDFELQGVDYTPEMIANKSGISVKIVERTLQIAENSKMADIDEIYSQAGEIEGPEEVLLKSEAAEVLKTLIDNRLNDKQRMVFYARVNLESIKERSYEDVAKLLGMTLKDVKTLYNSAITTLQADEEFIRSYGNKKEKKKKKRDFTIPIQDKIDLVPPFFKKK